MRRTWILIALIAGVTVAAAAAHYSGAPSLVTFVIATAALAGLAWIVSFSTEQVGERFGPGRDGRAAVDAREPARVLHRRLRALGRRGRRRADVDHRLDLRERATRARARDLRRLPRERRRRDALPRAAAEGQRHADAARELPDRDRRASRSRRATGRRITSRRSRSSAQSPCSSRTASGSPTTSARDATARAVACGSRSSR